MNVRASRLPRLFQVTRFKDGKSISGTGKVIQGVVFPDGKVVIQWQTDNSSIAIFKNLEEFQRVHVKPNYEGENEFAWIEGYEPADEVLLACDDMLGFVGAYSGGRISDKTRGDLTGKVIAIRQTFEKQKRGGLSPSTIAYAARFHQKRRVKNET